jgi:CheY-like chemotaxis protein
MLNLNTEVVGAAVNRISVLTSDIQTRNAKFLELLRDHDARAQGKNPVIATTADRITEEAQNVQSLIDAQEEVSAALNAYVQKMEEAADTSMLQAR